MTNRLLLLLLFCSFTVLAAAQTKPKFRVKVEVGGDSISEAESYIKRELRSLGDVEVSDKDPDFAIKLISLITRNTTGTATGIAYSWVTIKNVELTGTKIAKDLNDSYGPILSGYALSAFSSAAGGRVLDHQLWIDDINSLRKKCEEYVTHFDSRLLELFRKLPLKSTTP